MRALMAAGAVEDVDLPGVRTRHQHLGLLQARQRRGDPPHAPVLLVGDVETAIGRQRHAGGIVELCQ